MVPFSPFESYPSILGQIKLLDPSYSDKVNRLCLEERSSHTCTRPAVFKIHTFGRLITIHTSVILRMAKSRLGRMADSHHPLFSGHGGLLARASAWP